MTTTCDTLLKIIFGILFYIYSTVVYSRYANLISCVRLIMHVLHNISRFFQNIMIFGRAMLLLVLGRCHHGHIVKIHYFFENYSSQVTTVVVQLVRAFTSHGESREFDTRQRQIQVIKTGSESFTASITLYNRCEYLKNGYDKT